MKDSALHALAFSLLRKALRITPSNTADWGKAMLSELEHIEDSRAALLWAIGCAWTLVRAWLEEAVMQRKALVPAAVSVLALLSLLLIPGFRQGLNSSITSWRVALHRPPYGRIAWDPMLKNLAREAEEHKDARALAFVATRLTENGSSARAANRAVELDPNLTWVYYVVVLQNRLVPYVQELPDWSTKLKEWDPQNAAPLLFEAESLRKANTEWLSAIGAAAQAPRFDDYIRQQLDSDRYVVQRYGIWDPLLFIKGFPDRRVFFEVESVVGPSRRSRYADGALSRYLQQLPNGWGPPTISVSLLQIASLLIPGSIALLIVGMVWRRRLAAVGITGAATLILAATVLCIVYLPQSQIFHRLIADGDLSLLDGVKAFHTYGFPIVGVGKPALMRSVQMAVIVLVSMSWTVHTALWLVLRSRRAAGIQQ
jgi:hypothetical protein